MRGGAVTLSNNESGRLSTFPIVWVGTYGMEKGTASLHYLSLGVGFIIGLQISHPVIDKVCNVPNLERSPISCLTSY